MQDPPAATLRFSCHRIVRPGDRHRPKCHLLSLEPQIGDRLACGVRVVLSRFKAFVEPDLESTRLKHRHGGMKDQTPGQRCAIDPSFVHSGDPTTLLVRGRGIFGKRGKGLQSRYNIGDMWPPCKIDAQATRAD